jgi:uncharacterized protein YfdQ (DUF2303 family)
MIDKDAIEALQQSEAITAANANLSASFVTALPENFRLHDLEKHQTIRRRAIGVMKTNALTDFATYVEVHAEIGATVFVNAAAMSATAVLNLGVPEEPGQADNLAVLEARRTAAFQAMLAVSGGQSHSQQTIAEFLEDWPSMVSCFNDEGVISPPKAIAAVRKVSIEAMRKMENTEKQHAASRSAFESVQATSTEPLPTLIYFETVPYHGLASRLFVLRLGIRTGGDKPTITLRVQNLEQHEEEMANELAELVRSTVKTTAVLLGTYQSK